MELAAPPLPFAAVPSVDCPSARRCAVIAALCCDCGSHRCYPVPLSLRTPFRKSVKVYLEQKFAILWDFFRWGVHQLIDLPEKPATFDTFKLTVPMMVLGNIAVDLLPMGQL